MTKSQSESPLLDEKEGQNGESKNKKFTRKQWILIFLIAIMNMVSTIAYSLPAPFYPAEAERKGASATEYGIVFGLYEFTIFVTSPIFGKYMNHLGPNAVFNVCVPMTAIATICFGTLDIIEDHTTFIITSLICRFVDGVGCGGFLPATFTIVALEFPDSTSTIFASLETFAGLGLIIGPTIGEALYSVGGYQFPFYVVGTLLLVTGLMNSLVMPKIDKVLNADGTAQAGYSIWTMLKMTSVAIVAVSLTVSTISSGYAVALLEPHTRRFGLSPIQTGLLFIIMGGIYSLTSPLWGYICDKIRKPVYITIFGSYLTFVGFLFIGPASFMPFDTILWVTVIGLVLQGIGLAATFVSAFSVFHKESLNHGLPDNMATKSAVSGLWQSMMSLGAWVGPVLGGVLYDNVGFKSGSDVILAASLIMATIMLIHACCGSSHYDRNKMDAEFQPLMTSSVAEANAPSSYGSTF